MTDSARPQRAPLFFRLSSFYFFYFAALGALIPYLSLYFQHLGMNAVQIGQLMGVLIGTKVIAPNLWGWLADVTRRQVVWIQIAAFFSLVTLAGLGILTNFSALLGVVFVFSFFWHATLPLYEAYTFKAFHTAGVNKGNYGKVRLWGSVGFIAAVLLGGYAIERWGVAQLPWMLLAIFGLTFLSTLSIRELKQSDAPKASMEATLSFRQILRQPWIITLLTVSFLIQFSHGAYYSFYSIYLEGAGYSKAWIAWLWALGVMAEIGVFFYMAQLLHRWSAWSLLKLSLLLTAIRWLMIAYGVESLAVLLAAQTLHAASYGLFHAAAIYLIDHHFQDNNQARGQALYAAVSHGLGGGLGMLAAGYLWAWQGGEMTFALNSLVVILSLLLLWRLR